MAVVALILLLAVGIPVIIFSFEIKKNLTPEMTQTFVGVMLALVIVVVTTVCLAVMMVAYSKLRSKEEAADDQREIDLLRAVNQMGGAPKVTVHAGPGGAIAGQQPQGWEGMAPGVPPPARPPAIDYRDSSIDLS